MRLPILMVFGIVCAVGISSVAGASSNAVTCANSASPCISYQNTSSGSAVNFQGASGFGSRGSSQTGTGIEGKSASGSFMHPGIEGESTNNGDADAAGAFGLSALASGGTAPAYGVYALGSMNGVYGSSTAKYGLVGESNGSSTLGNTITAGSTSTSNTTSAGHIAVGADVESNDIALDVYNQKSSVELDIGTATDILSSAQISVDNAGNEKLEGSLTTSKSTYVETRGGSGSLAMSYGARTTSPRMEDDGEARLVNGRADVALDNALSDVIDRRTSYLVFVTPEGDSKGLYIASKTPTGFTVREQQGGRSTLAFQYRIVAKPIDDNGRRLARVTPERLRIENRLHTAVPRLTPVESLMRRLGPQEYAKEFKEFQRQQREK